MNHNTTVMDAMATLTLKGIPDSLMDRIRSAAETERRSLNQQVIHLLEEALPSRQPGDFAAFLTAFRNEWGDGDLSDTDFEGLRDRSSHRDDTVA